MKKAKEQNGTPRSTSCTFNEKWKDTFDWVERSVLGDGYSYCPFCDKNLSTSSRGQVELKRHMLTNKHRRKSLNPRNQASGAPPCGEVALRFISEYSEEAKEKESVNPGSQYRRDVESACQRAPYCVYVYGGVSLRSMGEGDAASVVLVGFFDVESNSRRVRFLDASRSGGKGEGETAAAKALEDFRLPKENLVAVYSEGGGEPSEQIFTRLRDLNPSLVALGGLYSVADTACRAGLRELFQQVQELVADIYAHYSSSPTKSSSLEALLGSDRSSPPNTSCLRFCSVVSGLLELWPELQLYFKSCDKNDDKAGLIFSQLQDGQVRARLAFLEQALTPLSRYQRRLRTQEDAPGAGLQLLLEEAANLLGTYASLCLRPQAAARFLKEGDAHILKSEKSHLPSADLNVRGEAAGELLSREALSFYITVTRCVAEELPLSVAALKTAAQLLDPRAQLAVAGEAVGELGAELGVCGAAEVGRLTDEFLRWQLAERETEGSEGPWAGVLKGGGPTSLFRKLLLTLLAFPCPPLEPKTLFAKVCELCDLGLVGVAVSFTASPSVVSGTGK